MRQNIKSIYAIISLLLTTCLLSAEENARENVYACDYHCTNIEDVAQSLLNSYQDGDLFSVIDLKSATVNTYQVVWYYDKNGKFIKPALNSLASSEHANDISLKYAQSVLQNRLNPLNVPADVSPINRMKDVRSSYMLLTRPQLPTWLSRYLNDSSELKQQLAGLMADIDKLDIKGLDKVTMGVNTDLVFEDGSSAVFSVSYYGLKDITIANSEYVENSAKFASAGKIPASLSALVGEWHFSHAADAEGFIKLGKMWGANFVYADALDITKDANIKCKIVTNEAISCEVKNS